MNQVTTCTTPADVVLKELSIVNYIPSNGDFIGVFFEQGTTVESSVLSINSSNFPVMRSLLLGAGQMALFFLTGSFALVVTTESDPVFIPVEIMPEQGREGVFFYTTEA